MNSLLSNGLQSRTALALAATLLPLLAFAAPDWVKALKSDSALGQRNPDDRMLIQDVAVDHDLANATLSITSRFAFLIGSDGNFGDFEYVTSSRGKENLEWAGAWILKPSGDLETCGKKTLTWNSRFGGSELYSDYLNAVWTWNNVETGSIIALEFTQVRGDTFAIYREYLQSADFPVRGSQLSVSAPDNCTVQLIPHNCADAVVDQSATGISVGPLPKWESREFDGGFLASAARIDVICEITAAVRTWPDVAAKVLRMWEPVRRDAAPALLDQVLPRLRADLPLDTLRRDYERAFRYVAIEIGAGGYVPHDVAAIAKHHYGDCKDLSLFLSEVWRQPELETCPVLVKVPFTNPFRPDIPSPWQFNHCILGLVQAGDTSYYDPTGRGSRLGYLASFDQGCSALWLRPGGDLITLPVESPLAHTTTLRGRLDESGAISGIVVLQSDPRLDRHDHLGMSKSERYQLVRGVFRSELRLDVTATEFENDGATLTADVRLGGYVTAAGDARIWQPYPFAVQLPDSVSSGLASGYYVDEPAQTIQHVEIALPAGFGTPVPQDTAAEWTVGSIAARWTVANDTLLGEWSFTLPHRHCARDQKPQLDSLLHTVRRVYGQRQIVQR